MRLDGSEAPASPVCLGTAVVFIRKFQVQDFAAVIWGLVAGVVNRLCYTQHILTPPVCGTLCQAAVWEATHLTLLSGLQQG